MSRLTVYSKVLIASLLLICLSIAVDAMVCTRRKNSLARNDYEYFECPPILRPKLRYCCGTEVDRFCCDKSRAHKERYGYGSHGDFKKVAKGLLTVIVTIILIVAGCIACCCFSAYILLRKRKVTRGVVLDSTAGTIGGQSVHMVNNPSTAAGPTNQPNFGTTPYPKQAGFDVPTYPSYQMQNAPTSAGDIPPPYPYPGTGANPLESKMPPFNPNYPQ